MNTGYRNRKVTVMGLGLHGGGSASAEFFAEAGAEVTVTDLRDSETLRPSIEKLSRYDIRYVLGRHDISDFKEADIVIKNPAVKPDSPYLTAAKRVETDISVFLSLNNRPIIAVTGSKGKSTTVSALHHVLSAVFPGTDLGGNITVSPLTFLNKEDSSSPVILELSSWQLADLRGRNLLKPKTALITNIMHDHQDRYDSMEDYAADKAVIFEAQTENDILLLNADSDFSEMFAKSARSDIFYISTTHSVERGASLNDTAEGIWSENGKKTVFLSSENRLRGSHNKFNLLAAASVLFKYGISANIIRERLSDFSGIAHRLEFVRNADDLNWYNDSAATIPEAAAAAVESFSGEVHLIIGGTDKNLDFSPLADAAEKATSISLLQGTGTEKIITELRKRNIPFDGPFDSLENAVKNVCRRAAENTEASGETSRTALLSPGCASFGMFKNEFDRGDKFKKLVNSI